MVPTQVLTALLLGGIDTFDARTLSVVGICRVLTVCDTASSKEQLLSTCIRNHLKTNVWDVPEPACIESIQAGLDAGQGVLVHCISGISREAPLW